MASTKYANKTKEELVAEIKDRKISVNLSSSNEKLINALELDDVSNGVADEDEKTDVKTFGTGQGFVSDDPLENQVPFQPEMPSHATQPADEEFNDSTFKARHKGDGFVYKVVVVPSEDRAYKARIPKQASGHPGLYWEGTEEEFKDCFEKF